MPALRPLLTAFFIFTSGCIGHVHASVQQPDEIVDLVQHHLEAQASAYPGSASVSVKAPRIRQQASCDNPSVQLPAGQRLRSRMTVSVRCTSPTSWTMHVQAEVSVLGYYYVTNRSINKGEILSLDDLNPREGDILRLASSVVTDPSLIVGSMAGQRLSMGNIIKSTALRDPQSVQRGQAVRTIARGKGFVISGEGQTLQGGAPGSQVQVRVSSGQVITATVLNAGTVQVIM